MLLMSLDAATAAELVKGLDAEVARELAVELAYLDATDIKNRGKSNRNGDNHVIKILDRDDFNQ